jgi:hypothetical protein
MGEANGLSKVGSGDQGRTAQVALPSQKAVVLLDESADDEELNRCLLKKGA